MSEVDFLAMLEQEAELLQQALPSDETLSNIADQVKRYEKLVAMAAKLEEWSSKVNAAIVSIIERTLPDAILETGITEFKLEDGTIVSVKKDYYPSVKDANKEDAYRWLSENGHDIIKKEVKASFSKGQGAQADEAYDALINLGFNAVKGENIHFQTFRAWAKEVSESATPIPETINIHIVNKAVIKRRK